jgi:carboxymethylenebutenolidase
MPDQELNPTAPAAAEPTRAVRRSASDFPPEVLKLFDAYVHGVIDRRSFLDRAAKFALAGTTAVGLLEALNPQFAQAEQVKKNDPRLQTEFIDIPSPQGNGKVHVYAVRPAKPKGKAGSVLVVHENRGLNPHIEDVARRFALEGYNAYAPDALFTLGGYPGDEDKARELFSKLDQGKTREDFLAAASFLKREPHGNGKLGVVGFCWGGGIAHLLATRMPDLDAAVPFYGMSPPPEEVAKVKTTLLVNLAEQDERINSAWPAYEAALKAAGIKYEAFTYPGTQHGFHNDTTPRYDEANAKLAWQRTLALFHRTLVEGARGGPAGSAGPAKEKPKAKG